MFAIALLHYPEELNSIPRYLFLGTFSSGFPFYRNTNLHLCRLPLIMALVFSILTSIRHFLQYSPNLFKRICSRDSDLDIKTKSSAYIKQLIGVLTSFGVSSSTPRNAFKSEI